MVSKPRTRLQPYVLIPTLASVNFPSLVQDAERQEPDLTLEQDLGPNPPSLEDLFGGDILSDMSEEEGEFSLAGNSDDGDRSSDGDYDPSPRYKQAKRSKTKTPTPPLVATAPVSSPPSKLHTASTSAPPAMKNVGQKASNARRRAKRKRQKAQSYSLWGAEPSLHAQQHVVKQAHPISVAFSTSDLEAAKGAHTGKPGSKKMLLDATKSYTLSELDDLGFRHIRWDGITPCPIVDREGRVISVLCGRPRSDDYVSAMDAVFQAITEEGNNHVSPSEGAHRRGMFRAYNVGVAMGMGSASPISLDNKEMSPVLDRLVAHPGVRRLAAYHNAAFSLWAPRLHGEYQVVIDDMYREKPSLRRNFPGVFSAATFNFGGDVWTFKHRDHFNWAYGWCFVTALGQFDHRVGGQLVLWELKLVVDFPHGATIAIPSAAITHSNLPVAQGSQRVSFTQYTAGAIFRWRENGFRTEKQLKEDDEKSYRDAMLKKDTAHMNRMSLYSTLEELRAVL
ncbi:hypothetical protein VNI00_017526 [Paramarasmius palmivorus]|uniref:Uncharacterized protein n=1 Tax=Paramarasmius palmivorus TaxID=297713 RepID=A0AAW0B631_9AGAR